MKFIYKFSLGSMIFIPFAALLDYLVFGNPSMSIWSWFPATILETFMFLVGIFFGAWLTKNNVNF